MKNGKSWIGNTFELNFFLDIAFDDSFIINDKWVDYYIVLTIGSGLESFSFVSLKAEIPTPGLNI